jgi:hypothetical protein
MTPREGPSGFVTSLSIGFDPATGRASRSRTSRPPGAFVVLADALDAALDTRHAMTGVFGGVIEPAS